MARKKEPVNEKKRQLNELGEQWKQYSPEMDSAAYEAHWLKIWAALFDAYYPYLRTEPELNAFDKTIQDTKKKFDPNQGTLSGFFTTHLNWAVKDMIEDELKWNPNDRIDPFPEEDDEGGTGKQTVDSSGLDGLSEVENTELINAAMVELMGQILNFSQNHNKKNGNRERKNYFELFYTSGVTSFVKLEKELPEFQHQRDIEGAMKMPFVDFCMVQRCRTIPQIFFGDLKPYGAVVPTAAKERLEKPIPLPIPDGVSISYLQEVEDIKISKSTYSEQKKGYKKEIKAVFAAKGIL